MTLTSNQAFRVGEVITQSVQTTIRNILPFGVVALIAVGIITVLFLLISAVFGLSAMMPGQMDPSMGMGALGASFYIGITIFGLLAFAIYMLVVAAIVYGTVQDLRGQPVGIGALLASAVNLRRTGARYSHRLDRRRVGGGYRRVHPELHSDPGGDRQSGDVRVPLHLALGSYPRRRSRKAGAHSQLAAKLRSDSG